MKIQTLYPVSFYGNNKKNNITNNKKEQQNIILNNKETDKKKWISNQIQWLFKIRRAWYVKKSYEWWSYDFIFTT